MKSLFGALLLTLTLMVSGMALYINMGNMLRGEPLVAINIIASVFFVFVWIALSIYSVTNQGEYSSVIRFYWILAFLGGAFCVLTTSGKTRILEYAAYLLLFFLTPLFGLRLYPMSHFTWSCLLTGIAFFFMVMAFVASSRRIYAYESGMDESDPISEVEVATVPEDAAVHGFDLGVAFEPESGFLAPVPAADPEADSVSEPVADAAPELDPSTNTETTYERESTYSPRGRSRRNQR